MDTFNSNNITNRNDTNKSNPKISLQADMERKKSLQKFGFVRDVLPNEIKKNKNSENSFLDFELAGQGYRNNNNDNNVNNNNNND